MEVTVLCPCRQQRERDPKPYDISDSLTREALELLALVHCVNNRAWAKTLRDKCELRFAEEEGSDCANNDEEDADPGRRSYTLPPKPPKFECERDREVPLSPRFLLKMTVGSQKPGRCRPWPSGKVFSSRTLRITSRLQSFGGQTEDFIHARR